MYSGYCWSFDRYFVEFIELELQISQLAEDRSYLNIQLGNLSKSLREKETELSTLQQQYRILYQTHLSLQTKVKLCL